MPCIALQASRTPKVRTATAASQLALKRGGQKTTRFASMSATTLAESGGVFGTGGGIDDEESSPPKDGAGGGMRMEASTLHRPPKELKADGRRRAKAGARQGAALAPAPSAAADIFGTASVDPYSFS